MTAPIFAIADVFDVLTSRRPYKDAFPLDTSLDILRKDSGSHFDGELVETFAAIVEPLYRDFAGRDEEARRELEGIVGRYFAESTDVPGV